jgi:sensor histidine kinase YesM
MMNFISSFNPAKASVKIAVILSLLIIYPNIIGFGQGFLHVVSEGQAFSCMIIIIVHFIYRYLFFTGLLWGLLNLNIRKIPNAQLPERLRKSFLISAAAYCIYLLIAYIVRWPWYVDWFTGMLVLQFVIAWLLPVLLSHIYMLSKHQSMSREEIERLRMESLQSRCEALKNQINPHFFFNSLNGLMALTQDNEPASEYIIKLSGIFRYILQSDKKELVDLCEELTFLDSYRYLLEVRYAGKIFFDITIAEEDKNLKIPVLSLLPLIENVVKHNRIDSENKMTITLMLDDKKELIMINPVHEKLDVSDRNGIGLSNLSARFKLLLNRDIKVKNEAGLFYVYLPLMDGSI